MAGASPSGSLTGIAISSSLLAVTGGSARSGAAGAPAAAAPAAAAAAAGAAWLHTWSSTCAKRGSMGWPWCRMMPAASAG